MTNKERKCKDRVKESLNGRLDDLKTPWTAYQSGEEETEDLGSLFKYEPCFDYVPAHTFRDQPRGYFRYQISWGRPSEEFRFLTEDPANPHPEIEFWLLDWFDGASVTLTGEDYDLLNELWDLFVEIGATDAEFEKAYMKKNAKQNSRK